MAQEIGAFLWTERLYDATDPAQQAWNCVLGGLAQMRLQFAERHLDRIEVGRVWRQITQCRARRFDRLGNAGHLVHWQIIHRDDVAALECWNQTLPHVKQKHGSIHGALQHERRGHSAQAQAGHKGDGFPMTVRRVIDQPLAARATAANPYHRGVGRRLVDKDQPCRLEHPLLAHPASARADHLGASLLGGVQSFFYR